MQFKNIIMWALGVSWGKTEKDILEDKKEKETKVCDEKTRNEEGFIF